MLWSVYSIYLSNTGSINRDPWIDIIRDRLSPDFDEIGCAAQLQDFVHIEYIVENKPRMCGRYIPLVSDQCHSVYNSTETYMDKIGIK
jgi:hypothetical protein